MATTDTDRVADRVDQDHEAYVKARTRVDALTDLQRSLLLAYLCGYRPNAVTVALDALFGEGGEFATVEESGQ